MEISKLNIRTDSMELEDRCWHELCRRKQIVCCIMAEYGTRACQKYEMVTSSTKS